MRSIPFEVETSLIVKRSAFVLGRFVKRLHDRTYEDGSVKVFLATSYITRLGCRVQANRGVNQLTPGLKELWVGLKPHWQVFAICANALYVNLNRSPLLASTDFATHELGSQSFEHYSGVSCGMQKLAQLKHILLSFCSNSLLFECSPFSSIKPNGAGQDTKRCDNSCDCSPSLYPTRRVSLEGPAANEGPTRIDRKGQAQEEKSEGECTASYRNNTHVIRNTVSRHCKPYVTKVGFAEYCR